MAKAGEIRDVRGRVLLRMRGGTANPLILEAAVSVARAFVGELRVVFGEDEELLSLAGFPFATEVSLSGGRTRLLSAETMREEMEAARTAMAREFEKLTRSARISTRFEVVRGTAESVLGQTMAETGILAIGEPLALAGAQSLSALSTELAGVTGLVVVSAQARRARGPIVVILDSHADIARLVDTAERIAGEASQELVLVITATAGGEAARIEREARNALDPGTRYRFEKVQDMTPRTIRALVRQSGGGLVVAHADGPAAADALQALRLACALDCPLLLLR